MLAFVIVIGFEVNCFFFFLVCKMFLEKEQYILWYFISFAYNMKRFTVNIISFKKFSLT